eukprot:TRINITY_DN4435_c2_g2_i1.p1 TRINITY_DN4435_c2_g2~~TRINITY_DN4435_c2_g2_i1.p1  ORF type:complete len:841 (+),score=234.65 TRINITY_DN4435_c2_g2_i1:152-2674(+)
MAETEEKKLWSDAVRGPAAEEGVAEPSARDASPEAGSPSPQGAGDRSPQSGGGGSPQSGSPQSGGGGGSPQSGSPSPQSGGAGGGDADAAKPSVLNASAAPWQPPTMSRMEAAVTAAPWRPPARPDHTPTPPTARPGLYSNPAADLWSPSDGYAAYAAAVGHGGAERRGWGKGGQSWGPEQTVGHGIGARRIKEKPAREVLEPAGRHKQQQQQSQQQQQQQQQRQPRRSPSPVGRGAAADEVDDVIQDPFADKGNFSWGLQALTGMAPLFEEDERKSPQQGSQQREGERSSGWHSRPDDHDPPARQTRRRGGNRSQRREAEEPAAEKEEDKRVGAQATFARARLLKDSMAFGLDLATVKECLAWMASTGKEVGDFDDFLKTLIEFEQHGDDDEADAEVAAAVPEEQAIDGSHPLHRWSPTLSMSLLNRAAACLESASDDDSCDGTAADPSVPMLRALGEIREDGDTFSAEVRTGRLDVDGMLRLFREGSSPPAGIPADILVPDMQLPEMLRHRPMGRRGSRGKEPCRFLALSGRCRRAADCTFSHEFTSAEAESVRRQRQQEREAEAVAKFLAREAAERRKDVADQIEARDRTVYMVGIDTGVAEDVVLTRLSAFGSIRKYQLCGDTAQPTRYGFFEYSTAAGAKGCTTLDSKKMFNRPVRVSKAKDVIKGGRVLGTRQQEDFLRAAAIRSVSKPENAGRRAERAGDWDLRMWEPRREAPRDRAEKDEELEAGRPSSQDRSNTSRSDSQDVDTGGAGMRQRAGADSASPQDTSRVGASTQGCSSTVSQSGADSTESRSQLSPQRSPDLEAKRASAQAVGELPALDADGVAGDAKDEDRAE